MKNSKSGHRRPVWILENISQALWSRVLKLERKTEHSPVFGQRSARKQPFDMIGVLLDFEIYEPDRLPFRV